VLCLAAAGSIVARIATEGATSTAFGLLTLVLAVAALGVVLIERRAAR
jgi:hypothetical protein